MDPAAASAPAPKLLLIDDDPDIASLLSRYLQANGFRTVSAASAAQARASLDDSVDLVLLDLGLPDEDGLSLLRHLQGAWRGPVIVVSGRGEAVERVVGLELGADDYVSKPFDLRELLARIRSVLRRAAPAPAPAPAGHCLEFGGYRLDLPARRLSDGAGQEVALTTGEFELLRALAERPREVLSRDQLMNRVHGRNAGPFDRAIDVGIGRLRRKIETDPAAPQLIKSVRGAGYVLAVEVRRA
ncbi:response regulator transcription factor [Lysobacter firmicutimachus]|uniref:Response regulator transcription factor n=1 Tax=Lysobacter firmicutimachus TaxID=1792846 RepID=A0ABU8D1W3_9GAMM